MLGKGNGAEFGGDEGDAIRLNQAAYATGKLAGVTGLEPATSAVTGQRSEPIELHPQPLAAEIRRSETRNPKQPCFSTRPSSFEFPCASREWALKDLNL